MRPAYRWRIIFGALLVCAVSGAVFLFSPKPVVADPENAHISFFHVRDAETGEPLWIALDEQTEREILQSLQTCEAVLTLYNPDRQMRDVMFFVSERDRITTIQLGENEGYWLSDAETRDCWSAGCLAELVSAQDSRPRAGAGGHPCDSGQDRNANS